MGIGFPPLALYLKALPLVGATCVVLFGELIQAEALVDEAREFRHGDENVHYDANRNNIICGMRNSSASTTTWSRSIPPSRWTSWAR